MCVRVCVCACVRVCAYIHTYKEEEMHSDLLITSCADNDVGYSDPERMRFFWAELPTSSTTCKILETFKFAHRHVECTFVSLNRCADN